MPRVVVTGLGLVSPHGSDSATAFDALLSGTSAVRRVTTGDAPYTITVAAATCEQFDAAAVLGRARAKTTDRVSQLALAAAQAAWADAALQALPASDRQDAQVSWGTGGGGVQTTDHAYRELFVKGKERLSPLSVVQGMHNAAASHIALDLHLGGACLTYSVACASSAVAIGEAFARVRSGACPVAIAGGSEAALPFGPLKAWQSMQVMAPADGDVARACRPFDAHRQGLVLGEGAAALVLESRDGALARGARVYAEMVGYGSTSDHVHLTAPQADGQARALRMALDQAGAGADELGYVNAHGTATAEGDPVEIDALRRVLGPHAAQVAVSATKSMHGHLMGAAGAIEAWVSVMALHSGHLPPTAHLDRVDMACEGVHHLRGHARRDSGVRLVLSNSFAFGGSNAVLAWRRHATG